MRKIISYLNNNKLEFLSLVIVILIGIFLRNQLSFKKIYFNLCSNNYYFVFYYHYFKKI